MSALDEDGRPIICADCKQPLDKVNERTYYTVGRWYHTSSDGCVRALKKRVAELEAERLALWRQVPANEGTVMTYAAVHVVRWRPEFGEPACGFIQADREGR